MPLLLNINNNFFWQSFKGGSNGIPYPEGLMFNYINKNDGSLIDDLTGAIVYIVADYIDFSTVAFMDRSNVTVFNDLARSGYYDSGSTSKWHVSELEQANLYLIFEDDYKYRLWSRVKNGVLKNVFLYSAQLESDNIYKAKTYVGVGEGYTTTEYMDLEHPHPLDYIIEGLHIDTELTPDTPLTI